MKKNLLQAIEQLRIQDLHSSDYQHILNTLLLRLEKVNELEPDGCGCDYRYWNRRRDELEYLIRDFEFISTYEQLNEFKSNILYYQEMYQGLKRLYYYI